MSCLVTALAIERLQIPRPAWLGHYTTGTVCFRIGIEWQTENELTPSMGLRITLKSALANPFLGISIVSRDDRI